MKLKIIAKQISANNPGIDFTSLNPSIKSVLNDFFSDFSTILA